MRQRLAEVGLRDGEDDGMRRRGDEIAVAEPALVPAVAVVGRAGLRLAPPRDGAAHARDARRVDGAFEHARARGLKLRENRRRPLRDAPGAVRAQRDVRVRCDAQRVAVARDGDGAVALRQGAGAVEDPDGSVAHEPLVAETVGEVEAG